MDGFNFQPGIYLFISLHQQQNELLNHSVHRLGQLLAPPPSFVFSEAPVELVAVGKPFVDR